MSSYHGRFFGAKQASLSFFSVFTVRSNAKRSLVAQNDGASRTE